MKKLICILAGAALLGACEQKTEVAAPAPAPEKKTEPSTAEMGQRPKKEAVVPAVIPAVSNEAKTDAAAAVNTLSAAATAAMSTETKTESASTPSP